MWPTKPKKKILCLKVKEIVVIAKAKCLKGIKISTLKAANYSAVDAVENTKNIFYIFFFPKGK